VESVGCVGDWDNWGVRDRDGGASAHPQSEDKKPLTHEAESASRVLVSNPRSWVRYGSLSRISSSCCFCFGGRLVVHLGGGLLAKRQPDRLPPFRFNLMDPRTCFLYGPENRMASNGRRWRMATLNVGTRHLPPLPLIQTERACRVWRRPSRRHNATTSTSPCPSRRYAGDLSRMHT
jgi:hypothetical protein